MFSLSIGLYFIDNQQTEDDIIRSEFISALENRERMYRKLVTVAPAF